MMKYVKILIVLLLALTFSCKKEVEVKTIKLSEKELTIKEHQDTVLFAEVLPAGASQEIVWASLDESIATVDANGRVHGVYGGRTLITATAGRITKSCILTVYAPVTKLTLSDDNIFMPSGKTFKIDAYIEPEHALNRRVNWTSSNPEVAEVSAGIVVSKSLGKTTVTAVSDENPEISAVCEVEVGIPVDNIAITPSKLSLKIGETAALSAKVTPANATYPEVSWTTDDPTVATVSDDGTVTAVSGGTTYIFASTKDGAASSCEVFVATPVESVSLDRSSVDVYMLESIQLVATVYPENATDKSLEWTVADANVASVDAKGVLTGLEIGTTTVTVKTVDGGFTANCTVTVKPGIAPVSGVSFEKSEYSVAIGNTVRPKAIVAPVNAADKSLTWKSSDTSIATVDAAGVVTGIRKGTVTITATSVSNPEAYGTCTLKVVEFGSDTGDGYGDNDYEWEG